MDESCYAYTGANEACNVCDGWENGLTKITGWHKLTDLSAMKEFVSTVGPVTACFTVYEDFYHHYAGGVYSYDATTAGNVIGGHCICIVGYDDSNSCWIAKNSWGTGWGENGYFRMSYGSCGLDAEMWAPEGIVDGAAGSRLELFARGSDHALWHVWQTAPNNGWSGWASMGGWIDSPVVACNADGRLEVFVIGSDHALWHVWQTAPNNGWSDWATMGGWIDRLAVGQNADGRIEVFARGSDHALWHVWQTAPNNGWSGWASMGGWIDRMAVGMNAAAGVTKPSMPAPAMVGVGSAVAQNSGGPSEEMPKPSMGTTVSAPPSPPPPEIGVGAVVEDTPMPGPTAMNRAIDEESAMPLPPT